MNSPPSGPPNPASGMPASLVPASQQALASEMLWRALGQLVERVFGVLDGDSALDDSLDIIVDLLGADRGLVLLIAPNGATHAINARRNGASLTPLEREQISGTIVREALETNRCLAFEPSLQTVGSIASFGIVGALAVKLRPGAAPDGRQAVLYLDYRDVRKPLTQRHTDFFVASAHLVGALLEQHARGEQARAHLQAARGHTTEATRTPALRDLLGTEALRPLYEDVLSALHSPTPMLILGENGTGKTLLAHAIAEASGRRPIVRAMLGASDDLNTITSELFGHEKGSFSGANSKRVGLVEFAHQGTLILDELLNLPMHAQKLLLDFTQFGAYRPLGHQRPEPKNAQVRIIAATNGDLKAAIRDGRFREDLYHRLAHVVLDVPPLRARREDIPFLAHSTLKRVDPTRGWKFSDSMQRLLVSRQISWSGNVRQLERVIIRARERAITRDPEATQLVPEHLDAREIDGVDPSSTAKSESGVPSSTTDSPASEWQALQAARSRLDEREGDVLRATLARNEGVISRAARELGIARTTFASRIESLGLKSRGE